MRNHNKKKTLKISLSVSTWILKNWKIIPSLTQNERELTRISDIEVPVNVSYHHANDREGGERE